VSVLERARVKEKSALGKAFAVLKEELASARKSLALSVAGGVRLGAVGAGRLTLEGGRRARSDAGVLVEEERLFAGGSDGGGGAGSGVVESGGAELAFGGCERRESVGRNRKGRGEEKRTVGVGKV
jgi:hypothetical protein